MRLLLLLILVFWPNIASATKMADIKKELAQKKEMHAELSEKSEALEAELGKLQKRLVETGKLLRVSEDALSKSEERLKDLHLKRTNYTKNLYQNHSLFGDLAAAAQRHAQAVSSPLILSADPLKAARAAMIMKSVAPLLGNQSDRLQTKILEANYVEQDISSEIGIQKEKLEKMSFQKKELDVLIQKRRELYKETEKERAAEARAVKKLTKEAKNLEDLMRKINARPKPAKTASKKLPRLQGNLVWPVAGKMLTGFGERDGLGAKSQGITFETDATATVVVPLTGKVKFAGPFQKFKQILIVEHAGGYHSLIAGLGRIDTVVGATVAAGEPVGATESAASPQIYYELRENGEPVNPQKLSLAQRKQEKT